MKKKKAELKEDKESKIDFGLSQETKNGVWGVLAIGLAIVSTLAFLGKAGQAGEIFAQTSRSLFGWGIFLVPVSLLLLGSAFLKSISRKIYISALIGTSLFIFSFLGLFYISTHGEMEAAIYRGGYLGLVFGYPLLRFVGIIASFVILFFLLAVSVLIALNIPIHIFWRGREEQPQLDENGKPMLKDNVVIKRGSEVIKTEEFVPLPLNLKPETKAIAASAKTEDREFVIKYSKSTDWILPPVDLLHSDTEKPRSGDINTNVTVIKRTLSNFGIDVEMGEVSIGPTVTQYTLRPAVGVKLSKIVGLRNDLALALAAHPIRIEAPIPGKALVGLEIPNKKSAIVGLRDLIESEEYSGSKNHLPLALGRDVAGFPIITALERLPHLLIAGATGTGKSVVLNTILLSLLYRHSPDMLKLILVDPKRVELSLYNGIPHLITPVIVEPKKVVNALKWAVREMEQRYIKLSDTGSRDVASYNAKLSAQNKELMPFMVIVIDELADLMAAHGRDVEAAIVRLAQMARAVGIHLIVSTQRPSVEVITGLIKANITSRVALQVASQIDSRTILDSSGAEHLLGRGDMLYQSADSGAKLRRVQGALVIEKEIKEVVDFIKKQGDKLDSSGGDQIAQSAMKIDEAIAGKGGAADFEDNGDELLDDAREVIIQAGKASASLLQRRLRVGYARAARLLDLLEERGIIGPGDGARAREVLVGRSDDDGAIAQAVSSPRPDNLD